MDGLKIAHYEKKDIEAHGKAAEGVVQKAFIVIQKYSMEKQANPLEKAEINLSGKAASGSESLKVEDKVFAVQFNPNLLSFSAEGGGKQIKQDLQKKDNKVFGQSYSYQPITPRVNLSLKLMFDCTLKKGAGIRNEVEGFVAAVRNPCTRQISFHWGESCFAGHLESVSAEYTMFDEKGTPVRGSVDLSIKCEK